MKAWESLPACENCAKALATRVRHLNESCTNIPHAAWEIFILIYRWVDTYHTIHDERSIKQSITIAILCDRSENRILPVHFRMALVLTSEMVSQVIISIFRRSLGKLKWKFPSRAERWWANQASLATRSSRVRTHHSTSEAAVRRLSRIIQRIFLPNQEAALAEPFGNGLVRVGS